MNKWIDKYIYIYTLYCTCFALQLRLFIEMIPNSVGACGQSFIPNSFSLGVSAQIKFGAASGAGSWLVSGGSRFQVPVQSPGWFWEVLGSSGAGSGLVREPVRDSELVSGGSENVWLCFSATSTLHLRCASPSAWRNAHTYTHGIGSKSSRAHIFQPPFLLGIPPEFLLTEAKRQRDQQLLARQHVQANRVLLKRLLDSTLAVGICHWWIMMNLRALQGSFSNVLWVVACRSPLKKGECFWSLRSGIQRWTWNCWPPCRNQWPF